MVNQSNIFDDTKDVTIAILKLMLSHLFFDHTDHYRRHGTHGQPALQGIEGAGVVFQNASEIIGMDGIDEMDGMDGMDAGKLTSIMM